DIIKKFGSNSFDCVISHGMLEHYSDSEIIHFLKTQLSVAPLVIFVVPINSMSKKYRSKGFGDERYLSTKYWKELIKKDFFIQFIFGFGFKEIGLPHPFEVILKNNIISRILAPICGINEFWVTSKRSKSIF
ncbi:MAG: class I SAM-dependent methyltransferase, partial [Patescibacteria group bacterium]